MKRLLVLMALVLLVSAALGHAQTESPITPTAALERLLTAEQPSGEWFTAEFLAQVPIDQVRQVIARFKALLGAYLRVEATDSEYLVAFEQGTLTAQVELDGQGRFAGLLFQAPRPNTAVGVSAALDPLTALPGQVGVLILVDGREQVSSQPDTPLAVGSTFKLAVLAALRAQIDAGSRTWSDVVTLQPGWKSLPSGILQDWPDGTPLTLGTLATLMISRSDNTATDALIATVGREAIEALTPRNRPLLTTREFFALKDPANADLLARYRAGNEAERRAVLAEVASRPLPSVATFSRGPLALDVEWFFTGRELCELIDRVADLPLMSVNRGGARMEDWPRAAFKGGSEPGVRNLTYWLEGANRSQYCVAATWNDDAALDNARFDLLVNLLIAALR